MHLSYPMIVGAKIRLSQDKACFFNCSGLKKTLCTSDGWWRILGTLSFLNTIYMSFCLIEKKTQTHLHLKHLDDFGFIQYKFSLSSHHLLHIPVCSRNCFHQQNQQLKVNTAFVLPRKSCFPRRLWSLPRNVLSSHLTKILCKSRLFPFLYTNYLFIAFSALVYFVAEQQPKLLEARYINAQQFMYNVENTI